MSRVLNKFVNSGSDATLMKAIAPMAAAADTTGKFTQAMCAAILASNDFHHIHLHAAGEFFDTIHEMANGYYDKADEEKDYLAELAMEYNEDCPNFSLAGKVISWGIESSEAYDFDEAVMAIGVKMSAYINYLKQLRQSPDISTDVQSKLDDMVRYWEKELNYKIAQRAGMPELQEDVTPSTTPAPAPVAAPAPEAPVVPPVTPQQ